MNRNNLFLVVRERLRYMRHRWRNWYNNTFDHLHFSVWLLVRVLGHRKRVVVLRRLDALGDVVCTLPLCLAIKDIYPECFVAFVTSAYSGEIVQLGNVADGIFLSRTNYFRIKAHYGGLIRKIYNPLMPDEYSAGGSTLHLVDEFAKSCGIHLKSRQPCLYPSQELLQSVRLRFHLTSNEVGAKRVIGINCGPTWKVREWDFVKWQTLVDKIHRDYDAVLLHFGIHISGKVNEYDDLTGVLPLAGCLTKTELVALIAICDLVISIDSGPIHIAGAVGTPVVGLFGAVDPALRLPPSSPAVAITSSVPCLFCHHKNPIGHWKTDCPNNIRCMRELTTDQVIQAVRVMFAR